jgi:hypothetical protein
MGKAPGGGCAGKSNCPVDRAEQGNRARSWLMARKFA